MCLSRSLFRFNSLVGEYGSAKKLSGIKSSSPTFTSASIDLSPQVMALCGFEYASCDKSLRPSFGFKNACGNCGNVNDEEWGISLVPGSDIGTGLYC